MRAHWLRLNSSERDGLAVRIQNGETQNISSIVLANEAPVTGLTDVLLSIRRLSDDYFLDFDDNVFKSSGWSTRLYQMVEVDATNAPGWYQYDFDTIGFSDDDYLIEVDSVSGDNVPQSGQILVGGSLDEAIAVIKGIVLENNIIDNIVYNTEGLATSARIRIFDSAANVPATGEGSETTGLIATFITSTEPTAGEAEKARWSRIVKA